MSVRNAEIRFTPGETFCSSCGHPRLAASIHSWGANRLWSTHCPACGSTGERASIPEWFLLGLPPSRTRPDLH